jgi:hypothetical protein
MSRPRLQHRHVPDLVDDVLDRPRAMAGENAMRAVGTELRTSAAGHQGKCPAHRPAGKRQPPPCIAALGDQVPARKRQRVQVVQRLARHPAAQHLACRQPHRPRLGLADDDEIARGLEQLRHLRCRQPDEPDAAAACPLRLCPPRLGAVVDERRQHDAEIAVHRLAGRKHDLVTAAREQRRHVTERHARQRVQPALDLVGDSRHPGEGLEAGPITARDGVLADESVCRSEIGKHDTHVVLLSACPDAGQGAGHGPREVNLDR